MSNRVMVKIDPHAFDAYVDPEDLARITDDLTVGAMWERCVREYADLPAIEDQGTFTYRDLDAAAGRIRAALQKAGVKAGDRVAILMPNCADFVKAYLGVETYGACAILLPAQLEAMPVFGCCYGFGAKAVLTIEPMLEKTAMVKEKLHLPVLTPADYGEETAPAQDADPDAESVIIFTGGTTGKSKGAILSHRAVLAGTKNGCYGWHNIFNQRYFLILPLTHVFGLIRNLMSTLYTGSVMFICRNNKNMFQEIAVFRPTIMVMVPALAEMALNLSKQFGRNMLGPDLKTIIAGAAVVAPYLVAEYEKLGITLLPGYGLTETANLVSGNPVSREKPSSVGYPYAGQELMIVDGELWIRGVNIMKGYTDPAETAAAFEDGWFKTGDLVRVDEDGLLYITGRTKEIIVLSNGENVSPAEIETRFNEIEAVQDSLVYADTNESGQEILAVQIYPRAVILKQKGITDAESYLREEINKVNATLLPYQRVSRIVVRDQDFKRSPAMKILRNQN